MKICILSDSHDHRDFLRQAVNQAVALGAQAVIHCGDLIGPSTLRAVNGFDIPIHLIHGNNTGDLFVLQKLASKPENQFIYHGQDAELTLGGRRIFMVHYPHYGYAMALTGDYDIVCCGHAHEVLIQEVKTIKNTLAHLINPGTVAGLGADAPTFIMADLETLSFDVHTVQLETAPVPA